MKITNVSTSDGSVLDDVITVSAPALNIASATPYIVVGEGANATTIRVKMCNVGTAAFDPDGTGAVYRYITFHT